jgi:hypothetical protein
MIAPPCPSLLAARREILPAYLRQQKDPTYFLTKELPPGAGRAHHPTAAAAE